MNEPRLRVVPGPGTLHVEGPLVEATVRPLLSVERFIGEAHPHACSVTMLIDTGATHTVLDGAVLRQLGARHIRSATIAYANGETAERKLYKLRLELRLSDGHSRSTVLASTEVTEEDWSRRPARRHQGLLGRNFLRNMRLVYDGGRGLIELTPVESRSDAP